MALPSFLYQILFFFTPLIFTSINSELFEIPKMYFIYTLTCLIAFTHLLNYFKNKTPLFSKNFLTLPFFIFILSQIVSTIVSIDVHTSLFGYYSRLNGGLISSLCFFVLFLILPIYLDDKLKSKIINISLLSGFFIGFYGILEHFGIDAHLWVQDVQTRVFSSLGQPNWLAAYLCILLPLALHKYLLAKTKISIISFSLLLLNLYTCLLFTKSKSGLIAAIVSLFIYSIFYIYKNKKYNKLLIFCYSVFILLSLTINNPIRDFIFPQNISPQVSQNDTINITPSGDIRKIVWQGAISLWQKYPLFGTGPETFAYSYYWVRPESHNLTSEWDFLYNKVHNEYLNFLATTGIFGFLSYLTLIFLVCFQFIKSKNYHLLAAFISILVTNFAGFSVAVISLYFFLLPLFSQYSSKSVSATKFRIFLLPLFIIIPFFLIKIFYFYLADLSFAVSNRENDANNYVDSYQYMLKSYEFNPQEPVYLSRLGFVSAQMAAAYYLQDDSNLSADFADNSQKLSAQALTISPFNLNLHKERLQALTYLSTISDSYYPQIIDSIIAITQIAPTDAKSFYILAKYYELIGQEIEAEKSYLRAIELKSNYDHAYFDLAKLYFDQKKFTDAKKYFELNLKYSPQNQNSLDYLKKIK